jgi:hypothetical protein
MTYEEFIAAGKEALKQLPGAVREDRQTDRLSRKYASEGFWL